MPFDRIRDARWTAIGAPGAAAVQMLDVELLSRKRYHVGEAIACLDRVRRTMAAAQILDQLRAVVFDMDGTLTESPLDFGLVRAECGVPAGKPILEYIERAPEGERERMHAVLNRHERRAAQDCTLRDGAREVMVELANRGMLLALLTRNSTESVRTVLERFGLRFDCWLSRHDAAPKPSPEPVLEIARRLALTPEQMLLVGDYVFDVQSGHAAGAHTAFLRTREDLEAPDEADLVIDDLRDLLDLVPQSVR